MEESIRLDIDYLRNVNYAAVQNGVPLVRKVELLNDSAEAVCDLVLSFSCIPEIFSPLEVPVDSVPAGSSVVISSERIPLVVHHDDLKSRTEREEGLLKVSVNKGEGNGSLFEREFSFSVLAANEWNGSELKEMVAAFVTPNDEHVEYLAAGVIRLLKHRTGNGSVMAYQGDKRRRVLEIQAIYDALKKLSLVYVNPPPSFEDTGQKIRTAEQIIELRRGACLDLTTLLCSLLEYFGFRPLIVFVEKHAFAGVRLVEEETKTALIAHAAALTKRVDLNEMLLVETTALTSGKDFVSACRLGRAHLDTLEKYLFAVEVFEARRSGVKPISSGRKQAHDSLEDAEDVSVAQESIDVLLDEIAEDSPVEDDGLGKLPRLERWKHRLLDLTRRNRLLNFRESKKVVPILCSDLSGVENQLSAGDEFTVLPKPEIVVKGKKTGKFSLEELRGNPQVCEFVRERMKDKQLHCPLNQTELTKRMIELSRAVRLNQEETGANTLFLCLGFLKWKETDKNAPDNLAPILLVPMQIKRRSAAADFRISMIEEESRINITLLQKLKTEYGIDIPGLDPLPQDKSGLDVLKIFRKIREAVKAFNEWDLVEEAAISVLTFSKFLMWLDLEDNMHLLKENPVVHRLLSEEDIEEEEEPEKALSETFCPLDADASQLGAIRAAAEGMSFVLQGPPGTGKSQTIANMIADAAANGKRVLFVAEKAAALNVVKRRLEQVGLGPFLLEVHSRNANKGDFRRQLDEALLLEQYHTPAEWEKECGHLAELEGELDDFVEGLHEPWKHGASPYSIFNCLIETQDLPKNREDLEVRGLDLEANELLLEQVRQLVRSAATANASPEHPLIDVHATDWSLDLHSRVRTKGERFLQSLSNFENQAQEGLKLLFPEIERRSMALLDSCTTLCELLTDNPGPSAELLKMPDWKEAYNEICEIVETGRRAFELRAELLNDYQESFLTEERLPLSRHLKWMEQTGFPKNLWHRFKAGRALKGLLKPGKKRVFADVRKDLDKSLECILKNGKLEKAADRMCVFGTVWNGVDSDWEKLSEQLEWVNRFRSVCGETEFENVEEEIRLREVWTGFALDKRELCSSDGPCGKVFKRFSDAFNELIDAEKEVELLVHPAATSDWCNRHLLDWPAASRSSLERWMSVQEEWRSWCAWQKARLAAVESHLGGFALLLEKDEVPAEDLTRIFCRRTAELRFKELMEEDERFKNFFGTEHQEIIDEFCKTDMRVKDLTHRTVFARLSQRLPDSGAAVEKAKSSEVGKLKRFVKGGRFTIRRVFKECPNALSRLKPCVLMSPLSVSQYLGADFPKFDLLIFDEASQMPPWEAIGAIARSSRTVIVGDSRQLPPTSFFEKNVVDDESDEEAVADLESILDECIACRLPVLSLKWHYRSRHESLIDFSNRHYYNSTLQTFPSPYRNPDQFGVLLKKLDGAVYDSGRTRTNRKEAEAIVTDIVARLSNPDQRSATIGVVTFSLAQQRLIEDLLEKVREENPQLNEYFSDDASEPVFVKNLETVQGDERDIILFSICYGPDKSGRMTMNFGPLNNKGGERRLNVAVTRARKQLVVYSSIAAEDIVLSRTEAVGVRHLRAFLEAAAKHSGSGTPVETAELSRVDPIVEDICTKLGETTEVKTNIGNSRYQLSLAVKSPETGDFILGVEHDGPVYRDAETARDRERLRSSVMNALGWKLMRVRTLEWLLNPKSELQRIQDGIAAASSREAKPSESRPKKEEPVELHADLKPIADPGIVGENRKVFVSVRLPGSNNRKKSFFDKQFASGVVNRTVVVVEEESPVLVERLAEIVARSWGIRSSERIVSHILALAPADQIRIEYIGERCFLWNTDDDPEAYSIYRVPDPKSEESRTPEEIHPKEVANLMKELLASHLSIDKDELIKHASLEFGFSRLTQRVRQSMKDGLVLFLSDPAVHMENDTVTS